MRLLLAIAFLLAAVTAPAATRVALVSTCGGEAGQNVLALAEVELSARQDIVLVERREVERVLEEQKLMRCGLSEAAQAVAAGRFLGVQVFACLETVPGEKDALGLVVFDAATGVVLCNDSLPRGDVKKSSVTVVAAVQMGCQKLQHSLGALTTLCIVSIRNADLPRELDSWCEAVGLLLNRRLVESPEVAVLDRKHLQEINRERELSSSFSDLLGSLVQVDLEIAQTSAKGEVRATATMKVGQGKSIGKVVVNKRERNGKELAQSLLAEIAKTLRVKPPAAAPDPAGEAEQFMREAEFLGAQGEPASELRIAAAPAALSAGEAAVALQPNDRSLRWRLARLYGQRAEDTAASESIPLTAVLDAAMRCADLSLTVQREALEQTGKPQGDPPSFMDISLWQQIIPRAQQEGSEIRDRIAQLQQACRTMAVDLLLPYTAKQNTDWRGQETFGNRLEITLREIEEFGSTPTVWRTLISDYFPVWLKGLERDPMRMAWTRTDARIMARLCCYARGVARWTIPHLDGWRWPDQEYEGLRPLFAAMQKHMDPGVRAYGLIGELALDERFGRASADERERRFGEIQQFLRKEMIKPSREKESRYRNIAYGAELDLIDLICTDAEARRKKYGELFDFMIAQRHMAYFPIRVATDPFAHTFRQYFATRGGPYAIGADVFPRVSAGWGPEEYPILVANGQRALQLFKEGNYGNARLTEFTYEEGSFDRELVMWQAPIFKARPELAPSQPQQWARAELVFDGPAHHVKQLIVAQVNEASVLAVARTGDDDARLVRIRVSDHQAEFLPARVACTSLLTCATIYSSTVYTGTTDNGLLALPTRGEGAEALTGKSGLPDDHIESVAALDGKLYVALNGGYIVARDLLTAVSDTVVSCRRKEKRSPLDGQQPAIDVWKMLADPPRHRVLFIADVPDKECFPLLGLWQIETKTGQVRQVMGLHRRPYWMGNPSPPQLLIHFSYFTALGVCPAPPTGVVAFDPATDRGQLLYGWTGGRGKAKVESAGADLPATECVAVPLYMESPLAIVNGWLWHQTGCISPDGMEGGVYPQLTREGRSFAPRWRWLQPLPDGRQVLAADANSLWLVELSSKPAKDSH